MIHDTEKMLDQMIEEDIELVIDAAPDPLMVEVDPVQIEQVIMNLSVNARDAMPRGGKLTIETRPVFLDRSYGAAHEIDLTPGHYGMMAVTDTGTGMDLETQAHIFEPFFTTKGRDKGTGLGLSTVYGIVKQSKGFIWVYSEPGKGTVFKIYLPRTEEGSFSQKKPERARKPPGGSETVLLVEDDEAVREFSCEILRRHGYTVLESASWQNALMLSEQHKGPIDLLLTDVVMPGKGGPDLALELTRKRPKMKVLYMSGYTREAAWRYGVRDREPSLLEKPFTADELAQKVRDVLDV